MLYSAPTARSFATKGHYTIDVDRKFAAFGAANIASALSQGFAVTGADSRTAVGVAAGVGTYCRGSVRNKRTMAIEASAQNARQYSEQAHTKSQQQK